MTDRLGRRELLAAVGATGFGGAIAYAWTELEPGRGRVASREVIAGERSLLYEDDERQRAAPIFGELGYDSPGDAVVSGHLSRLEETYGTLEFHLGLAGQAGREAFTTNVTVFDTVDLGDHISYQVSVADRGSIRTLSCVAEDAASLETRCAFEEVDVSEL